MGNRVLLVEGMDDAHVAYHLASDKITVEQCGGIPSLLDHILRTMKGSQISALAVIVDADSNPASRWSELYSRFRQFADFPANPDPEGTIVESNGIRFSAWMMPDNVRPGTLEDFLAELIPPDDDMVGHAHRFIDGIDDGSRRFKQSDYQKATLHAWLAIQEEPGCPYGIAIRANYFDSNRAKQFNGWLARALSE